MDTQSLRRWGLVVIVVLSTSALLSANGQEAVKSESVTWTNAWDRWWDGQQVTQHLLWGWPIFYWGRLGKIIQFLAACVVVAELLGADTLREFGRSLGGTIPAKKLLRSLLAAPRLVAFLVVTAVPARLLGHFPCGTERKQRAREYLLPGGLSEASRVTSVIFVISLTMAATIALLSVMAMISELGTDGHTRTLIEVGDTTWARQITAAVTGIPVLSLLVFLTTATLLTVLANTVAFAGALLDGVFIHPLVWLTSRKDSVGAFKIAGLCLLVIGFFLDLLAS